MRRHRVFGEGVLMGHALVTPHMTARGRDVADVITEIRAEVGAGEGVIANQQARFGHVIG
jgi:hypothetical protein